MEHTLESLMEINIEKSGHSDHNFTRQEIDHIAHMQGGLGQPIFSVDDSGTPSPILGAAVVGDNAGGYRWCLRSAPSDLIRCGKFDAAKFRGDMQYPNLILTLQEADACVKVRRRRVLDAIDSATTAAEAIEKLLELMAE